MQPNLYRKLLLKRRRKATLYLYLGILLALWICLFLYGQRSDLVRKHRNLDEAVSSSYDRYVRFTSVQQHSIGFYKFCIYHALIHHWKFRNGSTIKSLKYVREYLDIFPPDGISIFDVPFYKDALVGEEKLKSYRVQIHELATWMNNAHFAAPHQNDSVIAPAFIIPGTHDKVSISYWKAFIPYADTAKPVSPEVLEWVYTATDFDGSGDFNLNSSTDFSSTQAFTDRHYEFHELSLAQQKSGLGESWDNLGLFFKEQWLKLAAKAVDPESQQTPSSFSEVNLYGFSFNLIFFLYLIGPLIAGLLAWEYSTVQQLQRINGDKTSPGYLLFDYDRIFKGLLFHKTTSITMQWIEQIIRVAGVSILLYGCLFRYSYIDENNIPFNYFLIDHRQFEVLDIVNLICFSIAIVISSKHPFWDFRYLEKVGRNKWILAFTWAGLVFLPTIILALTYIFHFNFAISYYSLYGTAYFIVFFSIIAFLYRAHIRARIPLWQFFFIAILFAVWNWKALVSQIIEILFGNGSA